MAMTPLLAALLALGSITLQPDTRRVKAGGQTEVAVQIQVQDAKGRPVHGAAVRLTTQVGTVSAVQEVAPGLYRAVFTPPGERYPQVAILVADVDGPTPERAWTSVALFGVQALKLSTKPLARVEVRVEGKSFGPWTADARGTVAATVEVPPGVATAQVRSTDRVGNVKERPVALDPPPFVRVRVLPEAGEPPASWAGAPTVLVAYEVDAHGKPSSEPMVWTSRSGTLSTPQLRRPGEWVARFTAPATTGTANLSVQPTSSPPATLALPMEAGPAVSLHIDADHDALQSDGTPLAFAITAQDSHGNALSHPALRVESSLGRVEATETPGHYRLQAPTFWQGKRSVTVVARSGAAKVERAFPLQAGNAARGKLWLHPWLVYAGEAKAEAELRLLDGAGNPAGDETVSVRVGARTPLTAQRGDGVAFRFPLPAADVTRMLTEEVQVGPEHAPLARASLTTLPRRNPWGFSVGAWVQVQSNFGGASALTPTVELAARPARLPLELLAVVGDGLFSTLRHSYSDAGPDVVRATRVNSVTALVGARWSFPVTPIVGLHVSGLVGAAWTRAQTRLENSATPNVVVNGSANSWTARVAGGVNVRAGPGRFVAELQGMYTPISTSALHGNLGGLGLAAGYLFEIH